MNHEGEKERQESGWQLAFLAWVTLTWGPHINTGREKRLALEARIIPCWEH